MVEFPPTTSYHRMLLHRIARFYSLQHFVDGRILRMAKRPDSCKPILLLQEMIEPTEQIVPLERNSSSVDAVIKGTSKVKILKRREPAVVLTESKTENKPIIKSVQEQEAEYERARQRIFAGLPDDVAEEDIEAAPQLQQIPDYYSYEFHMPFYPSSHHPTSDPPASCINNSEASLKSTNKDSSQTNTRRTNYSMDPHHVILPKHILTVIGKLNTPLAHCEVRSDGESTIALFKTVSTAEEALAKYPSFSVWNPIFLPPEMAYPAGTKPNK
jgi:hypothetical protein